MNKKYFDTGLTIDERVDALISEMTLEEKASQCMHESPAIERLGVPEYNWWNECLHGVARAGLATVFPQAIGLAATFDPKLLQKIGEVIALEARAKHHEHAKRGDRTMYKGLTFWSPNINIFRDPRWGRGHETYGEDPYLTSQLGVAFVKGLQGNDPEKLKLCATPKHFAVHSGPEGNRLEFNATASEKDLRETYLKAFKACVKEAKASSIMSAYNAFNGIPCSMNKRLLTEILREEWGFKGCVVSDAGAVSAIHDHQKYYPTQPESAAAALNAGNDLITGNENGLLEAVEKGLITEEQINKNLKNLFRIRFRLGMFDPEETVPLSDTPYEVVSCQKHRDFAIETAKKSIVLLKNKDKILPLDKYVNSIAVIGPNADCRDVLLGNYNGTPSHYCTPLEGIRKAVSPNTKIYYARGCELQNKKTEACANEYDRIIEAVIAAEKADIVIMFMGLSPRIEGEAGDAFNSDASGDKTTLELPEVQKLLINKIIETGKPVILCLISGSALTVNKLEENIHGIIQCWYPGAEGGKAIAEILFGDCCPSGRLPVTFYKTTEELPPFEDYSMKNRTYRYMKNEALYPFGYGLSYTDFLYSDLTTDKKSYFSGEKIKVFVNVQNVGKTFGEEVVQLYIKKSNSSFEVPNFQLAGTVRVGLQPKEIYNIEFKVKPEQLTVFDENGKEIWEPGFFEIFAGGSQPDKRSEELTGKKILKTTIVLE